jgi:hypothetical protein
MKGRGAGGWGLPGFAAFLEAGETQMRVCIRRGGGAWCMKGEAVRPRWVY